MMQNQGSAVGTAMSMSMANTTTRHDDGHAAAAATGKGKALRRASSGAVTKADIAHPVDFEHVSHLGADDIHEATFDEAGTLVREIAGFTPEIDGIELGDFGTVTMLI